MNKYWIDQVYNGVRRRRRYVFDEPLLVIGRGGSAESSTVAECLAAGTAPRNGLGALVQRVQSGNIRSYAGWLAIGAAALLLITYFGFSMQTLDRQRDIPVLNDSILTLT